LKGFGLAHSADCLQSVQHRHACGTTSRGFGRAAGHGLGGRGASPGVSARNSRGKSGAWPRGIPSSGQHGTGGVRGISVAWASGGVSVAEASRLAGERARAAADAAAKAARSRRPRPMTLWQTASQIIRREGVLSLWSGLTPALVMAVPSTTLYFTAYDEGRQRL